MKEFFSKILIESAYYLHGATRYQKVKRFFYNLLENSSYPYKKYLDIFMIFLIFSSVFILIREVKSPVSDVLYDFNAYVISLIFLIEYILRFWVHNSVSEIIIMRHEKDELLSREFKLKKALKLVFLSKWEYVSSVPALIDLLAIVPTYHELRVLRIFILFRVFKVFRYTKSIQQFTSILSSKKFELYTLLMFASIVIFVSAVLIYVMEANNPDSPINSLFDAFYWALVTISTVGFGDITPITDMGRAVAMIIIVSGVAVLSFFTSIIVSAFNEKLGELRETKSVQDMHKLKSFFLICGYSDTARIVASRLSRSGKKIVVMDKDMQRIEEAKRRGLIAVHGDPTQLSSYKKLNINFEDKVRTILCLEDDDVSNVYIALTVRSISKKIRIISMAEDEHNIVKLKLSGVSEVVFAQNIVGLLAREFGGKPVAFEAFHAMRSGEDRMFLEEIVVDDIMLRYHDSIESFQYKRFFLLLLGMYTREERDFVFNPSASTPLREGDILIFLGERQFVNEFKKEIHRGRH
jgi:voltage-gated potassium channel